MYKDDKKYHMDLKENARGRFLKVSETFQRGYSRFQVKRIFKKKVETANQNVFEKSVPTTNTTKRFPPCIYILPIGFHSCRGNGGVPAKPG